MKNVAIFSLNVSVSSNARYSMHTIFKFVDYLYDFRSILCSTLYALSFSLTVNGQKYVSVGGLSGSRSNYTGVGAGVIRIHCDDRKVALAVDSVPDVKGQLGTTPGPLDRCDRIS